MKEVREWYYRTQLKQASTHLINSTNAIQPVRKGCINKLAEEVYTQVKHYDVKLPQNQAQKPTSFKKAGNSTYTQWFQAEAEEKDGMLNFNTWTRLDQHSLTSDMRRKALRCHHLYDIKRDHSAKNRVVVNGSKQHSDTYSDTTSLVAGQLLLRLLLTITAFRKYDTVQLDLTNAYLHAPIQDIVYIIIPDGFPGAGEIARLNKAAYGTKQGARRFYDYTAAVLQHVGITPCPNEPCLYRYLYNGSVCFILLYMDDALITGQPIALAQIQTELKKYFQCKFETPKDFLGLDIRMPYKGEVQLSMHTFTNKMKTVLQIEDSYYGPVLTPGRTDKRSIALTIQNQTINTEAM